MSLQDEAKSFAELAKKLEETEGAHVDLLDKVLAEVIAVSDKASAVQAIFNAIKALFH